jgi:large conductance mechanosensitive channel protein
MAFLKQFKEFAVKGNVLDLAVGVIIGAAFGKIVSSFISDVVMPPLGLLVGGVDVKHLDLVLKEASMDANGAVVEAVTLNYGMFIQNVVDFTFIAFVIFVAIKGIHTLKKKEEVPEEVRMAYGGEDFKFGKNYLIPKPFDPRVLTRVTPAVAKAAMDSGVARIDIPDLHAYARSLEGRMGNSAGFMKSLRDRLHAYVGKSGKKVRVVFAEGTNTRILQAVKQLIEEDKIEPILLGRKKAIHKKMDMLGLENYKDDVITKMAGFVHNDYKNYFNIDIYIFLDPFKFQTPIIFFY